MLLLGLTFTVGGSNAATNGSFPLEVLLVDPFGAEVVASLVVGLKTGSADFVYYDPEHVKTQPLLVIGYCPNVEFISAQPD